MNNKKNPKRVLAVLIIVFTILFVAGLGSKGITLYQVTSVIFVTPVKKISTGIRKTAYSLINVRAFLISKKVLLEENKKLLQENETLEEEIATLKSKSLQNERLREILNLSLTRHYSFVTANVIGITEMPFNFAIIDKGTNFGIKVGDPAIVIDNGIQKLVGVVYSSSQNTSKLLLTTDPRFYVSVKDSYTGQLGIAQGNKNSLKIIFKMSTPNIQRGDPVVTTSLSNIYPENILVGLIKEVNKTSNLTTIATIKPSANLNNLFEVVIIKK